MKSKVFNTAVDRGSSKTPLLAFQVMAFGSTGIWL